MLTKWVMFEHVFLFFIYFFKVYTGIICRRLRASIEKILPPSYTSIGYIQHIGRWVTYGVVHPAPHVGLGIINSFKLYLIILFLCTVAFSMHFVFQTGWSCNFCELVSTLLHFKPFCGPLLKVEFLIYYFSFDFYCCLDLHSFAFYYIIYIVCCSTS